MNISQVLSTICPADADKARAAKAHWDAIAKPLGSLGLLEDAVIRIAAATRRQLPTIEKSCVVAFCADNGVVCEGVTQTGPEVTAIVARNFCTGDTSTCKMAAVAHADVIPVDMGMLTTVDHPKMLNRRIAPGTKNLRREPAMTRKQAEAAVMAGVELAFELSDQGYELFATGEMGIGNTTTSSAVAAVLLGRPVAEMTGPGAGLSRQGVLHKIAIIEEAIALHQPNPADPLDVLSKLGGFDIAGMVGLCLGAAARKIPCLIDGFISGVAALLAARLCPAVLDYLVASHVSAEPAGGLILDALGQKPLITAEMRLGEGSGAVAAMPLLDMALAVYGSMTTFEQTNIEAYVPLS